jgi:hypothetical protein
MINLKKDDAVADAIREILQQEALKGDQHKIDANKNNKIDAHDFKLLRGKKKDVAEEVEQIDELSKSTLGSYTKKASRDATITRKIGADFENKADKSRSPGMKNAANSIADMYKSKSWKRKAGVDKAVDRLTKEEVESVEESMRSGFTHRDAAEAQARRERTLANNPRIAAEVERRRKAAEDAKKQPVQERTLSSGETAEKERIVKGMKKSLSGFKARYGDKAKSVMYATATKSAKNEDVGAVSEAWKDMMADVRKRAEPQPSGGSGIKQGSRYGGSKQKPEKPDEEKKK